MAEVRFIQIAILVSAVYSCYPLNINNFIFSGRTEFVELDHPFDDHTIYWPNDTRFSFSRIYAGIRPQGWWYASNDFCAGEHGGTHMDAPYHFTPTGSKIGDITLDQLIVPLYIVDISDQVDDDPNFVLNIENLDNQLDDIDTSRPCLIVFKFGWTKFYSDPIMYLGIDGVYNGTLNFPGVGNEVAELIVNSYPNVVGIGMDVASIDPGSDTDLPAHRTVQQAGLYIIENVKLDRYVPQLECTALVFPMKITEGTGAPLRLAAICPA